MAWSAWRRACRIVSAYLECPRLAGSGGIRIDRRARVSRLADGEGIGNIDIAPGWHGFRCLAQQAQLGPLIGLRSLSLMGRATATGPIEPMWVSAAIAIGCQRARMLFARAVGVATIAGREAMAADTASARIIIATAAYRAGRSPCVALVRGNSGRHLDLLPVAPYDGSDGMNANHNPSSAAAVQGTAALFYACYAYADSRSRCVT